MEACNFHKPIQLLDREQTSSWTRKYAHMPPRIKRAFSLVDVFVEERSGVDVKTEVTRMFSLHPQLVALINEHQFEELSFPTYVLPMKVKNLSRIDVC